MLTRADKIFIGLIGAGLLSIYIGVVSMYLWLGLMLVRLFFLNRVELGLFSLMFGSNLFGRMVASDHLVVVLTTGFLIMGYILLRKEIVRTVVRNKVSWIVFGMLIFYFVVMYLLGPMNSYAMRKIARLVVRGITWLFMFQIYVQSRDVNNKHFAILFGLLAVFYLSQSYVIYGVCPNGLFDVSFFRDIATSREARAQDGFWVSTHTLGYMADGAIAFLISKKNIYIKSLWIWIFLLVMLYIVIVSGARQAMILSPVLIAIRIFVSDGHYVKNAIIATLSMVFIIAAILSSGSAIVEKSLSGNNVSEVMNRDVQTPFKVISINPILGVGFGGYAEHGGRWYPHNMFFEIVAEFGIIGGIILFIIFIIGILISNFKIRYLTSNGSFFILFLMIFSVKSLISGDLSSSIIIFSIILSFI